MVERLIQDGAEEVASTDIRERSCQLHVQNHHTVSYSQGLRLDADQNATYRYDDHGHRVRGNRNRMCDFAVLATVGHSAHLVAIELKSGVARVKDIEQLIRGLEVLRTYWSDDSEDKLSAIPAACLVIGKRIHHFRRLLVKKPEHRELLKRLKFGSERVELQTLECGETLLLSSH